MRKYTADPYIFTGICMRETSCFSVLRRSFWQLNVSCCTEKCGIVHSILTMFHLAIYILSKHNNYGTGHSLRIQGKPSK